MCSGPKPTPKAWQAVDPHRFSDYGEIAKIVKSLRIGHRIVNSPVRVVVWSSRSSCCFSNLPIPISSVSCKRGEMELEGRQTQMSTRVVVVVVVVGGGDRCAGIAGGWPRWGGLQLKTQSPVPMRT